MIAAAAITKQYLTMFSSHLSRMRSGAARSEQTSAALLPLGSIAISSVAQRWRDRLQSNARRRLEDTKYGVGIPRFALHPVRPSVLGPHVCMHRCHERGRLFGNFDTLQCFRNISKITAVDHPNSNTPFIAIIGPSRRQRSTGTTSPYPGVVWFTNAK